MSETTEMGRVLVTAKIENLDDLYQHRRGEIADEAIRRIVVKDALIDSGATRLALPSRLVSELGLEERRVAKTMTAGGPTTVRLFGAVQLTVNGRDCLIDVTELSNDCPVLIGQVPLELMDWVIDMRNHQLIPNPAHDGDWVQEMYWRS